MYETKRSVDELHAYVIVKKTIKIEMRLKIHNAQN